MSVMPHYKDNSLRNPFQTISNSKFPKTIKLAFDWALYLHDRFPVLGNAICKVVRYFAADISVTSNTSPLKTDTLQLHACLLLLKDKYNLIDLVIRAGELLATMGNLFISALRIFDRWLCCPNEDCGWAMAVNQLHKGILYLWKNNNFTGICPQCHSAVTYKVQDHPSIDLQGRRVRFIIRSPRDMLLKYNELTGLYKYLYRLPGHIKEGLIRGDEVYLQTTPMLYLQAAKTSDLIIFPQDKFFHARIQPLSSMDRFYKGWGTPLFLSSFNNVLRLAYLDKFNEAVATDYIAPVRMISPAPQNLAAGSDPNKMPMSGYMVRDFIKESLMKVRDNPSAWVISPIPLQYTMLGGLAKQMAPVELMKWYLDRILLDESIPVEMRQTSFQQVAPSMGMRMFLRQWVHFAKNLQLITAWAAEQICNAHSLLQYKVVLEKTSFIEDDMNKQIYMQLAPGGVIAQDTLLRTIGLDFKLEQHKLSQLHQYQSEQAIKDQAKQQGALMGMSVVPPAGSVGVGAAQLNMAQVQQENMAAAQGGDPSMGGGMPPQGPMPPGAPMGPAGTGPMPFATGNSQSASMDALYQNAEAKAQLIFQAGQQGGQTARTSMLRQLKAADPILHAQVKQLLLNMDAQTASQAVAQSKMPQG